MRARRPATCTFEVDGEEARELMPHLLGVEVDLRRDRAGVAVLRFATRRDGRGRWSVQDAGLLRPWARVRVKAVVDGRPLELLRGYVREVEASYPEDPAGSEVAARCQNESLRLDRRHRRTVWGAEAATDDRSVAAAILSRHELSLSDDSAPGLAVAGLGQDDTDAAFLRSRAEANGYELLFREGKAYFGPPRLAAEAQKTILVHAGRDGHCLGLTIRADGHRADRVAFDVASEGDPGRVEETVAPGLQPLGSEAASSERAGLGDFIWRLRRCGAAEIDELRARARGKADELSLRVRAEGELDGTLYGEALRVGEPVGLGGVGRWLGGTYYVDAVRHLFDAEGYRQAFTLLRNAYGPDPAAGGAHAGAG